MEGSYNLRNPAVKRLMREAEELRHPTEEYYAQPLEGNLFEWHFTVRGPPNTDFDGGVYHGRITLPPEYPMKPPSIILLTPNGRFETNKKICLSISGHHPESWQPSWSIRTALLAIIGFMPTHANGAIGALDYTPEERQGLAKKSQAWTCADCGDINNLVKKEIAGTKGSRNFCEATEETPAMAFAEADMENYWSETLGQLHKTEQPMAQAYLSMANEVPNETAEMSNEAIIISNEASVDITSTHTPPGSATKTELRHTSESEEVQSPPITLPRQRLPHSDREPEQPSTRIHHSVVHRNHIVLPSAATSTTFIGILTFLIVFLLLRRLSTYIDCF